MISNTITSSVIYTVTYVNSITNDICHAKNYSCTSSCCTSSMPLHCYRSHGDITVSLVATNQLGSGPTTKITIGTNINFIL